MKKAFIILFILAAFTSNAQIIQNVITVFDGKVTSCVDTIEHSDYNCQINAKIDSIDVCPEYDAFITMCKQLDDDGTIARILCQNTVKQTFEPEYPQRIFVDSKMFRVANLTTAQQKIYNDFINKVKSQITY